MTINDAIQGFQNEVLSLIPKYELHPALASVLLQNCEHIVREIALQADKEEKDKRPAAAAAAQSAEPEAATAETAPTGKEAPHA